MLLSSVPFKQNFILIAIECYFICPPHNKQTNDNNDSSNIKSCPCPDSVSEVYIEFRGLKKTLETI